VRGRATPLVAALAALACTPVPTAAAKQAGFRAECLFTHRLSDDPIVHPGHPGMAHSHDFFGNRSADAFSTTSSLRRGRTSCEPAADGAAYWLPTLYDAAGSPVTALSASFYYRASTHPMRRVRPYPLGLRMIAGDAMARRRARRPVATWSCLGAKVERSPVIRRCPRGASLRVEVRFPDCWNGRDLDSADHRSHMAYSRSGRCRRSRPVPVPQLLFVVDYPTRGSSKMRVASGRSFTEHADFFNAWQPDALRRRVRSCLRRGHSCDPYGLPE
jgi:hypothetical protein